MPSAFLSDRAVIEIRGQDAEHFLQNLITTDVGALADGEARPGALLTPQGKILFEFLISRSVDGFHLETHEDQRDGLIRRLTMYKLRAAVEIKASATSGTTVFWGETELPQGLRDHRFAVAGVDLVRIPGQVGVAGPLAAYDALRVLVGVPDSGSDFALEDVFPHDVLYDKADGVSFRKGCYVGQEVVSRMQHRGTARRRLVLLSGDQPLPVPGSNLTVDGKPVGTLGTVVGQRGLAIARIDKIGEALAEGKDVLAGGIPVSATLPRWSGLNFPTRSDEA
ncbi:folate-binding protein YgfZ [Peteryoungia desertarenae]|uniref:Folate-binding protein YgfZ n=1 Tax=Peteryoungia desertarenae TaxID=1813451 RepID=A0ABX6QNZ1_9HYPH|nr:folate-binding protein YgfZ [Peteryoungia desertarenae]QLF69960.1 folate-binding protein YgfZ [Peteryoungia desertarenae]